MSTTKTFRLAALAALLAAPALAAGQSQAQPEPGGEFPAVPIRLGGYFWLDTGYMQRDNTQVNFPDQDTPYMQGRFGLLAGYEKSVGTWKLDAQAEFLALDNENAGSRYEAHILNAFVKLGQEKWDVQAGRFLNSEVFYRGQGIELYTAEEYGAQGAMPIYHLDTIRGHQDQPGQLAVHYRPLPNVRLEVAGVYGFNTTQQAYGVRPVMDVEYAGFRLFAGYEYQTLPPNSDQFKLSSKTNGYAARLQYKLPFVIFGVNYSARTLESYDNDDVLVTGSSGDQSSVGGFADFYLGARRHSLGLGYYRTTFEDERELRNTSTHDQAFVTYLHRLPFDGFSLKGVVGFARAENEDRQIGRSNQNDLYSFRLRVAYDFQ